MKIISTILQWLFVIALVAAIYFAFTGFDFSYKYHLPHTGQLQGYEVIIFAFAIAFTWVEILRWGVTKPFNCVKCMSGWLSLLLALVYHTPHCYFYLPLGLFVGAMYSAIKMRYL